MIHILRYFIQTLNLNKRAKLRVTIFNVNGVLAGESDGGLLSRHTDVGDSDVIGYPSSHSVLFFEVKVDDVDSLAQTVDIRFKYRILLLEGHFVIEQEEFFDVFFSGAKGFDGDLVS